MQKLTEEQVKEEEEASHSLINVTVWPEEMRCILQNEAREEDDIALMKGTVHLSVCLLHEGFPSQTFIPISQ